MLLTLSLFCIDLIVWRCSVKLSIRLDVYESWTEQKGHNVRSMFSLKVGKLL